MKIYLKENVYDAAIKRFHRIYDEFENVIICTSGGKDSTVTMELALQVAEERGRLPMKVLFVDQECEYRMVVEYMRHVMADPRVEPLWLQVPIKITNSVSADMQYLNSWHEGEEWMREKEEISIKENVFGVDEWSSGTNKIFDAVLAYYFPNQKACMLAGVRTEESPTRLAGLTTAATYKDITWGKVLDKKCDQYTFYPIWDWTITDVWKSIHDNGWRYCKIYDELYRMGTPPTRMRVSSLNHETAVHSLFNLQEIEGDTWNALVKRVKGVNQTAHIEKNEMLTASTLPSVFKDWKEYRDHLLKHLVTDQEYQDAMRKKFAAMDKTYALMRDISKLHKVHVATILAQDIDFTKASNFEQSPYAITYRRWKRGDIKFVQRSEHRDWIPMEL
jgi:predicted phosphoadenosine phosphosulfate sulfurtransferase